jgi:hypothetical protein
MKYVQWVVVFLAITSIVVVMIFPPWKPTPTGARHYRLSGERLTWWAFNDWRVDRWDLFTELATIGGISTGVLFYLNAFKRRRRATDREQAEGEPA